MKKIVILLACAALCAGAAIFYQNEKEKQEFTKDISYALNTIIEQKWFGKNRDKTIAEVGDALSELENRLSSYVEISEISVINEAAGEEPVVITEDTYDALLRAKQLSLDSDGCFDMTVFPLVKEWDITGDNPHIPSQENIDSALSLVGAEKLVLSENEKGEKTAFLPEKGMGIDLGGIAKGMAADTVREIALKNGTVGYASLGGNLSVIGRNPNGSEFKFGVRNPRGTNNEYIGIVELNGKTMATTGDYERYFEEDGIRYHHVMDLSTGYPTNKGLISVTVISEDGMLADCLSTWIFNDGFDNLKKYLSQDKVGVIAVDSDLNVYVSDNYKDKFIFEDASGMFTMKEYENH